VRIISNSLTQILFKRFDAELAELRNRFLIFNEKLEEELIREVAQKILSLTSTEKLELILGYLTESPTPYFLKWLLEDGYFPRYYFQKRLRLIRCSQCGRIKVYYARSMCKRCYNKLQRIGKGLFRKKFFKKEVEF